MPKDRIIKGEAYSIAFDIVDEESGEPITDEMVDGIRIALGHQVEEYPEGNLTYSAEDGTWRFPMSQCNTYSILDSKISYQVQIKIDGEIFSSEKEETIIESTMFRKEW